MYYQQICLSLVFRWASIVISCDVCALGALACADISCCWTPQWWLWIALVKLTGERRGLL
jgi:hypothetical protein